MHKYHAVRMIGFCLLINVVKKFSVFYMTENFYTLSLALPFALLLAITFLPFFVAILALKPCVLFLAILLG